MEGLKSRTSLLLVASAGLLVFIAGYLLYNHKIERASAAAATCYWVGDTDGANWNDTSHWSSSAGGTASTCDGGVVPGTDDTVIFSSDNLNSATINSAASIKNLTINASYTGTITISAGNSLTVATTFTQHDGTFTTGDQNVTAVTYVMDGGTFNAGASTIYIQNFTHTSASGTFNEGTSTIKNTGLDTTYDVNTTETFYNYEIYKNGGNWATLASGDTLVISGNLTLTDGVARQGTYDVRGNITQAATMDGGSAVIDFGDNAVTQSYTIAGGTGPTLRLDNSADGSDSVILNADATLYGLNMTAGFDNDSTANFTYNSHNLTIGAGGFTLANGTFNAPTTMTFAASNFTHTAAAGSYVEGTNTVFSTGSSTLDVNSSETFNNVQINIAGNTLTIASGDTMVVSGALTLTDGYISTGTIDARGNITQASTMDGGSATLNFGDDSVAQTYTVSGGTGPNLRFDSPSDANDLVDLNANSGFNGISTTAGFTDGSTVPFQYDGYNLTVYGGGFTLVAGTFNAPTTMTFSAPNFGSSYFTHTAATGTFNEGTNTVFSGYAVGIDCNATETFNNVTIDAFLTIDRDFVISSGDTMVVSGTLTLTRGTMKTGTADVKGDVNIGASFAGGNAPLILSGSGAQTYSMAGAPMTGVFRMNKSLGSTTIVNTSSTARTVTLSSAAQTTSGLSVNTTGSGGMTLAGATNNPNVTISGGLSFAKSSSGVPAITMGSGTWSVSGDVNLTNSTITAGTSTLTLNGSAVQSVTSASQSLKNVTITNASAAGVSFADNLTVTGTFTDTTPASTLTFKAGSTYAFANISITGASGTGNKITLKSSISASPWYLNVTQDAPSVSYVTVSDSDATAGSDIIASDGTSVDGTGNTAWLFGITYRSVSGTVFTSENESTNIGADKTIALSVNGGAATTVETTSGGAFSFASVDLREGYSFTLYIDDETEKGSYIAGITNLTGVADGIKMYTNRIELDNYGDPITNAHIVATDVADTDSLFNSSGTSVSFTDGYELWVASGKTFTPGGAVQADDVEIAGTLDLGTNTMTIGGSLVASSGTLSIASGTLNFAPSSTETVSLGANTLGNIQLSGSGSVEFDTNIVAGDLVVSGGSIALGNNTRTLTANSVTLDGGSITTATQSIPRTKIFTSDFANNSGTFTLGAFSYMDCSDDFASSSTTTLSGFSKLYVAGDFTISGGTYSDVGSTVYLDGAQNAFIQDAPTAFNSALYISKDDGYSLTLNDDLVVNDANLTISSSGTFSSNGRVITLSGTGSKNFSPNGKTINNLVVTGAGGMTYMVSDLTITDSLNVGSGATLDLMSGGDLTLNNNCSTTLSGTLGSHYIGDGLITLVDDAGTNFPTTGTLAGKVRFHAATKNVTVPSRTYYGRVELYNSGSTSRTATLGNAAGQTITIGGHGYDNYYGSGLFVYADGSGNMTADASVYNPTVIVTSYEVLNNGDLDFLGSGTGTEIIKAGNGTWSVKGDIDFTNGTFTPGSSTLVLNGSGSQTQYVTLAGQQLNNLTVNNNSTNGVFFQDPATITGMFSDKTIGSKITFNSGSTYSANTMELRGSSAGRVVLRSSTAGAVSNLNVANPSTVYYVDVMDSNATSGSEITANDGTSINSGNNTNWNFTVPSTPTPVPTATPTTVTASTSTREPSVASDESTETPAASKTKTKTSTGPIPTSTATVSSANSATIGGNDFPSTGDEVVVSIENPVIQGKTEPNAIIYIKINGDSSISEVVKADAEGNWTYSPKNLKKGEYNLQIEVKNSSGETIDEKVYSLKVLGTSAGNQQLNKKTAIWLISAGFGLLLILVIIIIKRRKERKKAVKR